ncbi:single-stranded DNA-binding protein, partial [Lactiplantibacillus argentoratensis]
MRQITISGNLGKDPEVRQTQSGMQVANFSLAVRQNRPDDQGNYGTDWFRCA